jgi:hypothetical protein
MSPEARERSFDALATGLASGSISRGRALRLMGAALVGGRWDHQASVRLLPTVLGVSALGRCVRRTRCAVAATATVSLARAPLVRPALSSVATGSVRAAAQKTAVAVRPARAAPAHVQQTHTVLANGTCARRCTGGASCPTGFCYDTNEGSFCAGGGGFGNCLGLGNAGCPTGSVCTGPDCLTVTC